MNFDNIGKEKSKLVIKKNQGHFPIYDNVDDFVEEINQFINQKNINNNVKSKLWFY